ncbi:MAG: FecR domain-containing protein [Chitinophaga sp.]|uniref:FecR family protein n=1 Tax=Chitinophaga sp. TaxID=1869181 RepID=UPI0025C0B6DF|nr:FecR family protein [Chitinophaga sp.]MBV8256117.1 FecR domain-containing protein [Chitinophaga sp.]
MPTEKNSEYYQLLLQRWQERKCSPTEAMELMDYIQRPEADRTLLTAIHVAFRQMTDNSNADAGEPGNRVRKALLQHIHSTEKPAKPWFITRWKYLAAAAVVSLITIPVIRNSWKHQSSPQQPAIAATHDIAPGKNRAVLTLANGEKIVLDSAGNQIVGQQGNSSISNNNGQLVYTASTNTTAPVYNTLSTAPGETYTLSLADGSRVWLNAASSIHFPASFSGKERHISLEGEAYFEVAANPQQPFRITVQNTTIDVLGTSLNINAYTDEQHISTTLLQGSVKVSSNTESMLLTPGQQSQVDNAGKMRKLDHINTAEIIAWKEGLFQFENTDLNTVLRQFAHWYNVEIVYEGHIKPRKFFGIINRNSSLMNVLKMLNANDISFRLEGKKLIVQGD